MKALIIGCDGQLGTTLRQFCPRRFDSIGIGLPKLDICNAEAVNELCDQYRPAIIINAAAYTAVDRAESEPDLARSVNVGGPRNIAAAAKSIGARLIHVSTDFVFDGTKATPYTTDDEPNPLGVYGQTKLDGERVVLATLPGASIVLRTAWLYSKTGSNFVTTMLRLMAERDEIVVVSDQTGAPTWANSLAEIIWKLAEQTDTAGLFHWTDGGNATWYEFATAIQDEAFELRLLDRVIPVHPIKTKDYPAPARRPGYSVLDCSATTAALGVNPVMWRRNLRAMLKDLKN